MGFPIFALLLAGSAGFAACANLKSAPVADDAGGGAPPATSEGGGSVTDASAPVMDASDDVVDATDPRYAFCSKSGATCTCLSFGIEADASSCTAADFPSGFCCADPGWPAASDSTCTCGAWTCHTTASNTCVCGTFEAGTAPSCSDALCCAHPIVGTCTCAASAAAACPSAFADANNIPIASCTQATQPCPRGGTRVSACGL